MFSKSSNRRASDYLTPRRGAAPPLLLCEERLLPHDKRKRLPGRITEAVVDRFGLEQGSRFATHQDGEPRGQHGTERYKFRPAARERARSAIETRARRRLPRAATRPRRDLMPVLRRPVEPAALFGHALMSALSLLL